MIAVLFAVPHESRDFRRQMQNVRRLSADGLPLWGGDIHGLPVLLGHTGIGPAAAKVAAERLFTYAKPAWVISAGYGGALDADLRVGDVVVDWRGSSPLPARLPDRCVCGTIASHSAPLETPEAKAQFAQQTGAIAVDMESAAISVICAEASVGLTVVRSISDAAGEALPVPMECWFDLRRQRPKPARLLGFLLTHPNRVAAFGRFVQRLPKARAALTKTVLCLMTAQAASEPPLP